MEKIKYLEKALNLKKQELEKEKRTELHRINKEFIFNEYERRFKIDQEHIVSIITGIENKGTEYTKQLREQKVKND